MWFLFLPVGNSTTVYRFPYVTLTLIILNTLVFIGSCKIEYDESVNIEQIIEDFDNRRRSFELQNARELITPEFDSEALSGDAFTQQEEDERWEYLSKDAFLQQYVADAFGDYRTDEELTPG